MGLIAKQQQHERKGAIVEKLADKRTKREAVIRLEKGHSMTFWCQIDDLRYESKDGGEVKRWAESELKKTTSDIILDWQPVLEVRVKNEQRYGNRDGGKEASLIVEADRYYMALTLDQKRWLTLLWEQADPDSPVKLADREMFSAARDDGRTWGPKSTKEDRGTWHSGDKPFTIPSFDGSTYYLAYTDEVWAGIGEVLATLKAQEHIIKRLLGTKAGMAQLAQIGLGTLPLRLSAGARPAPAVAKATPTTPNTSDEDSDDE